MLPAQVGLGVVAILCIVSTFDRERVDQCVREKFSAWRQEHVPWLLESGGQAGRPFSSG
jgi:hypothetical protein